MKQFLTCLLIFNTSILFGQIDDSTQFINKKYFAWYSPSSATHVYGIMFNVWPKHLSDTVVFGTKPYLKNYPIIYGTELNISPITILASGLIILHSFTPEFHQPPDGSAVDLCYVQFKTIHGLRISFFDIEPSIVNGLDCNLTGSFDSKTNGVTISLFVNRHLTSNGVTFGLLGNHDVECHGLQIGLFNSTNELRGIQIGLWNRNEKRALPLVNWNFRD
jgi:hypothetical protein